MEYESKLNPDDLIEAIKTVIYIASTNRDTGRILSELQAKYPTEVNTAISELLSENKIELKTGPGEDK
jgi:hypothetical protein